MSVVLLGHTGVSPRLQPKTGITAPNTGYQRRWSIESKMSEVSTSAFCAGQEQEKISTALIQPVLFSVEKHKLTASLVSAHSFFIQRQNPWCVYGIVSATSLSPLLVFLKWSIVLCSLVLSHKFHSIIVTSTKHHCTNPGSYFPGIAKLAAIDERW